MSIQDYRSFGRVAKTFEVLQVSSDAAEPETPAPKLPSAAPADDTAMLETNDEDLRMALQMSMVSRSLAPAECKLIYSVAAAAIDLLPCHEDRLCWILPRAPPLISMPGAGSYT